MSTKYNNNTLSGITFVDSNGSKTVYGVIFNGEKAWGRKRNLYVHYSYNVIDLVVSRTQKGYEPTVSTGTISGIETVEQFVMQYYVYAGDTIRITASTRAGYIITGGTGTVLVSTDSSSDIHVYITVTEANVVAEGDVSQVGSRTFEQILVQNNRSSSIRIVAMDGNLLPNTAAQLPVTIQGNSSSRITGTVSGAIPVITDYTIHLTLSDGTVVTCPMVAN